MTVKHGQFTIEISMHPRFGFHAVVANPVGWEVQDQSLEMHMIVLADYTLKLFA